MKIKVAKVGNQYSSSFLPGQFFNSKQDLVKAAKTKLAGSPAYKKWEALRNQIMEELRWFYRADEPEMTKIAETAHANIYYGVNNAPNDQEKLHACQDAHRAFSKMRAIKTKQENPQDKQKIEEIAQKLDYLWQLAINIWGY